MLRDIQPLEFVLARDAQRHEQPDQLEQDEGYPARPNEGDCDSVKLDQDLLRMTLEQPGGPADGRGREDACKECPGQAADAVDAIRTTNGCNPEIIAQMTAQIRMDVLPVPRGIARASWPPVRIVFSTSRTKSK